jgi:hypothetical protein
MATDVQNLIEQFKRLNDKIDLILKENPNIDELQTINEDLRSEIESIKIKINQHEKEHDRHCPYCENTKKLTQLGKWEDFVNQIKTIDNKINKFDIYWALVLFLSSTAWIAIVGILFRYIFKVGA